MMFTTGLDFSLSHLHYLVGASASILLLCVIGTAIYNVYFHPLASYPGPKLNAAFGIFRTFQQARGNLPKYYAQLHERHGNVVRVSPTELSYTTDHAWTDAYAIRHGHEEMPKHRSFVSELGNHIAIADRPDHQRMRRLLSHAFTPKALKGQEPLIKTYVDLLIQRLRETNEGPTNIVSWYNFTTFDLVGDLAFGESFNCLEDSKYHSWVSMLFEGIKMAVYASSVTDVLGPASLKILPMLLPTKMLKSMKTKNALVREKVARRLSSDKERPDFTSYILRHNGEDGMTRQEIEANSDVLIIAGSETSATTLSGATYFLLQNPAVMKKLLEEVRSSFKSEEEITFSSVSQLPYILAVLNEAIRMYPPAPGNLLRVVPKPGDTIGGKWVPGGTRVAVCQWAAFRSQENWKHPESFIPERWMGDPEYESDNRQVFKPFSYGPRDCIGRSLAYVEMRLILARVLWNFDLELMPESEDWTEQKAYVLWEKRPLYVKLTPVH